MDPLIGAAAISSLSGFIGQGIENRKNMKLARYSYKKDLAQWHRQNAYNSPTQQMARLKAAGLNPNLVYGTGAVGNTTSGGPSFNTPEFNLDTKVDPQTTLALYNSIQETKARTNNINQDTQNKETEGAIKKIEEELIRTNAEKAGIELGVSKETSKYQVEGARLDVEKRLKDLDLTGAQIAKVKSETKLKDTQNEIAQQEKILKRFEALWAEKGITKADNIWVRVLSRSMDEAGMTLESSFQAIEDYIKSLPAQVGKLFD